MKDYSVHLFCCLGAIFFMSLQMIIILIHGLVPKSERQAVLINDRIDYFIAILPWPNKKREAQ